MKSLHVELLRPIPSPQKEEITLEELRKISICNRTTIPWISKLACVRTFTHLPNICHVAPPECPLSTELVVTSMQLNFHINFNLKFNAQTQQTQSLNINIVSLSWRKPIAAEENAQHNCLIKIFSEIMMIPFQQPHRDGNSTCRLIQSDWLTTTCAMTW